MRILTFGSFDLPHVGHIRLLQRARALGETLMVGISSDELCEAKKGRKPVYSYQQRVEIVSALRCVSWTFPEESLEAKRYYIERYRADILVMGDDWAGKFDDMPCRVVYLPRTAGISTTDTLGRIRG